MTPERIREERQRREVFRQQSIKSRAVRRTERSPGPLRQRKLNFRDGQALLPQCGHLRRIHRTQILTRANQMNVCLAAREFAEDLDQLQLIAQVVLKPQGDLRGGEQRGVPATHLAADVFVFRPAAVG